MPVLPLFREFTIWTKTEQPGHLPEQAVSQLYSAHARLRVAKRFEGILLRGLSTAFGGGILRWSSPFVVLLGRGVHGRSN